MTTAQDDHDNEEIHEHTCCNGCSMNPIKGPRYECTECAVDLCRSCFLGQGRSHAEVFHKSLKSTFCRSETPKQKGTRQESSRTKLFWVTYLTITNVPFGMIVLLARTYFWCKRRWTRHVVQVKPLAPVIQSKNELPSWRKAMTNTCTMVSSAMMNTCALVSNAMSSFVQDDNAIPPSSTIICIYIWTTVTILSVFAGCGTYDSQRFFFVGVFYFSLSGIPFKKYLKREPAFSVNDRATTLQDYILHITQEVYDTALASGIDLKEYRVQLQPLIQDDCQYCLQDIEDVFRATIMKQLSPVPLESIMALSFLVLAVFVFAILEFIPSGLNQVMGGKIDDHYFLCEDQDTQDKYSPSKILSKLYLLDIIWVSYFQAFCIGYVLIGYGKIYCLWKAFDEMSTTKKIVMVEWYSGYDFSYYGSIMAWSRLRKTICLYSSDIHNQRQSVVLIWMLGTLIGLVPLTVYGFTGSTPLPAFYYIVAWITLFLPQLFIVFVLCSLIWTIQRRHFSMLDEEAFKLQLKATILLDKNNSSNPLRRKVRLHTVQLLKTLSRMLESSDDIITFFGFEVSPGFLQTFCGTILTVVTTYVSAPMTYT